MARSSRARTGWDGLAWAGVVAAAALVAGCSAGVRADGAGTDPSAGAGTSSAARAASGAPDAPAAAGGTSAAAASSSGSVAPAEGTLSAEVVQYRRDAQRDVLQVKVRNSGDAPVQVASVRLDTATFTEPVEVRTSSRIGAGVAADLTVPLGEPACSGVGAAGGAGQERHVVTLEVDGRMVELDVVGDVLEQVATERCEVEAVRAEVDLSVAPAWEDAGLVRGEPALRGVVEAAARPDAGGLRLAVEGATTLFTVAEPSTAELPPGTGETAGLPVVLTVTRCDPHAVAEDKKGYLLPVRVAVDGAEPVLVEVPVPVPERGPLQELIDTTCGFA